MLHFHNALVHHTEVVREDLASFGFSSMTYAPYSPDLTPCDFFFGAMKRVFAGQHFATIDNLLMSVEAFPRALPADFLQTAFQ
jgi:transposase